MPWIRADENAIEQVLQNLLENAVKYSGNSKAIDLVMSYENEMIVTSIQDYGIGIAENEQQKIYERFYRSGNQNNSGIKGSGIGLTLVKEILNAHGGNTNVESAPGEGSRFYFRIPVCQ